MYVHQKDDKMEAWATKSEPNLNYFSDVINHIGRTNFGDIFLKNLTQSTYVDFFSVYTLNQNSKPKMYVSGSLNSINVSSKCFNKYTSGLFSRDHTFDKAKELAKSNVRAMTHWHESEFPKDHRNAIYAPFEILDRLSIVDASNENDLLAVNFYRYKGKKLFTDNDIDVIQNSSCQMLASIRKHIEFTTFEPQISFTEENNLIEALKSMYPELSDRELQICSGLLMGKTYDGIAATLGISLATVKTYRARAYEKLGIHFKSELFSTAKLLVHRELTQNRPI